MNASASLPRVDLRSDTVTRPTPGMREAMAQALVGDDVFGDDPSVNELQTKIAKLLGFEAALFMPTGTQSNLCGVLSHCQRGDEYIVGQLAHTYRFEGGGAAVLGSIQPQPLAQDAQGRMALADIAAAIKPDDPHFARTRLLCLENTWNGHVMPDDYLRGATALARGILSEARDWSASAATDAALERADDPLRLAPFEGFRTVERQQAIIEQGDGATAVKDPLNLVDAFLRLRERGRTSKAPISESFGHWPNLRLVRERTNLMNLPMVRAALGVKSPMANSSSGLRRPRLLRLSSSFSWPGLMRPA